MDTSAENGLRYDWSVDEILKILQSPLDQLCLRARSVHEAFSAQDVQKCMLLSVKTGNCPEDCGYCSQSAHYKTTIAPDKLLPVDQVMEQARFAKAQGAARFCMGAAWRDLPTDARFERVVQMVEGVAELGMEVCGTFGMATTEQLKTLKEAGLTAYNHNLDTSREYYPKIVSTRTYDDRLDTLKAAREAGVQVCCGGILGLGESERDRAALLTELANLKPHPESVPINLLVPIEGTPMAETLPVPFEQFLRMIATSRIVMPRSRVRLSAGRNTLSESEQRQCFEVGANSIFVGEKLLTAPNVDWEVDRKMLENEARLSF